MDYLFRCFMRRRRLREVDEDLVTDLPRSDRAARNVLPRTSVPEDVAVDEGVIGFLYECDQFIDSSGIHDPIRGVRTHNSIRKDVRICRYLGEYFGIREKNRRAVAGIGGKIAFAGSNESDEETDVFIDGNVGGNISSMINSHCTLHNAYLRKETEDFLVLGLLHWLSMLAVILILMMMCTFKDCMFLMMLFPFIFLFIIVYVREGMLMVKLSVRLQ